MSYLANKNSISKTFIVPLFLLTAFALGQSTRRSTTHSMPLNVGVDMGEVGISPLHKDSHQVIFTLTTSWIPGERHLGYLRYRMRAYARPLSPDGTIGLSPTESRAFIDKLHTCEFSLILYDSQGFKLRRIALGFQREMFGGASVQMSTNEMTQMDLSDYQAFLSSKQWDVYWSDEIGACHAQ